MWTAEQVQESLGRLPDKFRQCLQRIQAGQPTKLDRLWLRPWEMMPEADPWQREVLMDRRSSCLILASRGSGKSAVTGRKALWNAMANDHFVLVISASETQAYEYMRKNVIGPYWDNPLVPLRREPTMSEIEFEGGGRVVATTHSERSIRGYQGVDWVVLDEAALVTDDIHQAAIGTIKVKRGHVIALTTPKSQRGWFWEEWHRCDELEKRGLRSPYFRRRVPWTMCPRIRPEDVEADRQRPSFGPAGVAQEYECVFHPASAHCPIDIDAMQALLDDMRGPRGGW